VEVVFEPVPPELAARLRSIAPFAIGATGQLFTGVPLQGEQPVLLKIFAPSVGAGIAERTRCKRELRKQATIVHSHLPAILDDGETGGRFWLLRELVHGETLAVQLRRQGMLTLPDALAVVAQLASALDELHRQGLVHRDVKPGHVLLTSRPAGPPQVRLIDAGMAARLPGEAMFESYGTAAYAAPEIAAGKPASFRSDLYSLGCMLYEMLSGTPPFTAASQAAVLAAHRELEPNPLDTDLPVAVRSLLDTLLAKEPRRRPFSARQVRRALDPHLPANMPESPPPVRSVVPPPSAAPAATSSRPAPARRGRGMAGSKSDHTEELSIEELELTGDVEARVVRTQELDLADLEQLPPQTKTQELQLADIQSVRPPGVSPKTQELELSDMEALPPPPDVKRARRISAPAPAHESSDQHPTVVMRSEPPAGLSSPEPEHQHPSAQTRSDPPHGAVSAEPSAQPMAAAALDGSRGADAVADNEAAESAGAFGHGDGPASSALHAAESAAREDAFDEIEQPPRRRVGRRPWLLVGVAALLVVLAIGLKLALRRASEMSSPAIATADGAPSVTPPTTATAVQPIEPAAAPPTAAAAQVPPLAAAAQKEPAPAAAPVAVAEPGPGAAAENIAAPAAAPSAAGPGMAEPSTAQPPQANEAAPQMLAAAEAGKAFLRDGGAAELGGVVPYKPRSRPDIDYKSKGLQLFQAGKFREAADAYERASQKTPSDPRAFAGLGASWLSAGEPDRAILAYQRAVQLKPDVSGFQAALGRAYLTKGDRARAAAAYSKALALDPANQAAKTGLASLQPK
jgi:serine/threonine-protein kinase